METAVKTKEPAGHMSQVVVELIPITTIAASPTNPRKTFDKDSLAELAESIKVQGLVSPIVIRPLPEKAKAGVGIKYELVAGERRWRATKLAGLAHIPALIRTLNDREALEIQITENLQRKGLDPMEEADAYAMFREFHKDKDETFVAEQIADKIGMSRAYVYNRLKLRELGPQGRKALANGTLDVSKALLIARIPVKSLQKEALDAITDKWEPMNYKQARDHVQEHFMLDLANAPFDPKDALLVPGSGSCTTCPKRTGNQPDLFGDVKSRDVCTDPPCFQAKRQAVAERKADELKAKGKTVITGNKAAEIARESPYDEDRITIGGGYQGLDDTCRDDPKGRTVRQIVGKNTDVVEVVQTPKKKELVEVVSTAKLTELLNEKGIKTAGQQRAKQAKQTRKDNEKEDLEEEITCRTIAAIYKKHNGKLDRAEFLLVAEYFAEMVESYYYDDELEERIEIALGKGAELRKKLKSAQPEELQRLLLLLGLSLEHSTPVLRNIAKRHKVDVDKIRREVLAPVKTPTKGKKNGGEDLDQ